MTSSSGLVAWSLKCCSNSTSSFVTSSWFMNELHRLQIIRLRNMGSANMWAVRLAKYLEIHPSYDLIFDMNRNIFVYNVISDKFTKMQSTLGCLTLLLKSMIISLAWELEIILNIVVRYNIHLKKQNASTLQVSTTP